ncbi:MAG: Ig domain-containing protein [Spirochaetales bacterium]|nr:Ig domain-containing protein [Candidatus Physcosoma equi]
MKNIRNIALALVAVLLVGFLAVSCDEASLNNLIRHGDHTHVLGANHKAVASTCMAKGSVEWYECEDETCLAHLDADCKELKTIEVDIDPNAHAKGTNHASTNGDCQTKGTIEYWDCSNGCGSKIDADCKALPSIEGMLGSHAKGTHHEATAGNCQTNSTVEYWDCSVEGCTAMLNASCGVITSYEGSVNPALHPAGATTTWTTTTDTHKETYDCCGAVKTAEASHSYVAGVCVCGQDEPIVDVINITLNKTTMSINVGADETLSATVAPTNATNKAVNWSSSDTTKATVDATGKVTGVAEGTATITATAADGSGVTATCEVTVSMPEPEECVIFCELCDYDNWVWLVNGETW